jgi:hypothetical protein
MNISAMGSTRRRAGPSHAAKNNLAAVLAVFISISGGLGISRSQHETVR